METQTVIIIVIICLLAFFFLFQKKEKLSNTCNKKACNAKMREFINNSWSFNNSAKLFKECRQCDSLWFRSSDMKTSEDGNTWEKQDNLREVYNELKM